MVLASVYQKISIFGIRLIAIVNILRRLVVRAADRSGSCEASTLLRLKQRGFRITMEYEAAVHAP